MKAIDKPLKTWMGDDEINLIKAYLTNKPDSTMLEWGSGGSTLEYSPYVKHFYSVEHNIEWFNKVYNGLKEKNIDNVDMIFVQDDPQVYCNIHKGLNTTFDFVLVDGRYRAPCAINVLKYLNYHGIVFVHDYFNRDTYKVIESFYTLIDKVDSKQSLGVFKSRHDN